VPLLVLTHEPRVAHDIGRQDGRQAPLYLPFTHDPACPKESLSQITQINISQKTMQPFPDAGRHFAFGVFIRRLGWW